MGWVGGARKRLGGLDTAFLGLESGHAPMHLGALAVFQPPRPVPPARLLSLLCDRAERVPALRMRVAPAWFPPGAVSWVEDRRYAVGRHVRVHELDRPGTLEALSATAAGLMAEPLDLSRPPWQLHVLTGLADGRFALLVKLHHAMADGLRAVELGLSLLDACGGALADTSRLPSTRAEPNTRAEPASLPSVTELVQHAADLAGIAGSVLSAARLGTAASPLPPAPAPTSLPTSAGAGGRRLELVQLDLAGVRRVRRRFGGTDHDVLLAVLAGALHDWLAGRGQEIHDLRILIPVSRRPRTAAQPCGNALSGYLCELPVRDPEPLTRLRKVRHEMERNKRAGPTRGAGAFPLLAELLPPAISRLAAPLVRRGASRLFDLVATNVPIPGLPLTLAGAPLRELYPIVPLAHGQPLGIALSAYRGTVHVGLHADGARLPDLDRLADAVPAALTDLVKAVTRRPRGPAFPEGTPSAAAE